MAQCHGMQNFECTFCYFSTPNKTSMRNHRKMYCRELKNQPEKSSTDTSPRPKPVIKKVDGITFYKCALCDYMGKSFGKIDGHMVTQHGYEKFRCDYCKFSTPNSTSMHNHKKLYCRSLKKCLDCFISSEKFQFTWQKSQSNTDKMCHVSQVKKNNINTIFLLHKKSIIFLLHMKSIIQLHVVYIYHLIP